MKWNEKKTFEFALIYYYYSEFMVTLIFIEWSVSVLFYGLMCCGVAHGMARATTLIATRQVQVYIVLYDQIVAEKKVKLFYGNGPIANERERERKVRQIAKWIQNTVIGESAYVVKIESEIGSPIGIYHCTNNICSYFCNTQLLLHTNACCVSMYIRIK